jgi:nitrous oxidase accessory protein
VKLNKRKILGYLTVLVALLSLIPNIKMIANATAPSLIQQYSIQELINNANNGSTIIIHPGIYQESITINKTLKILGENKSTTIIQANATDGVKITANGVYFSGFTVRNGICGVNLTASSCTVSENIFYNNSFGIALDSAINNTINGNVLINNTRLAIGNGILLNDRSSQNSISGNTIINSGEAVYVLNSDNNTVAQNSMFDNYRTGVCLMKGAISADHNRIYDNVIIGGAVYAIDLYSAKQNVIFNNTLKNNGQGFEIENSKNNTFYRNNIIDSWKGMYLLGSRNNTFYQNNIIDNYIQISGDNSVSTWDNGFDGNYWSDYTGTDANHDGIGDTSHFLCSNNTDDYPLMKPYMEGDANHDGKIDIKDASLIGIAWNTTKGTVNYNPHADLNTDDTIDVADAEIIRKNWQKTYKSP